MVEPMGRQAVVDHKAARDRTKADQLYKWMAKDKLRD